MIGLLFQLFAASADGQAYLPKPRAALHVAQKAAASAVVYEALGPLKLNPAPRFLVSTLGVFLVAKGIEVGKGHRLGPVDTVHDLFAHSVVTLPVASRRGWPAVAVGLGLVATCKQSSPRWC